MTQEQKAKRYDEAIKIAKEINNEQRAQPFNVMTRVFPELKESDEKIRKALIDGFTVMKESKNCGKTFSNHNIPVVDILAWLEKQGEQKPLEWHREDEQNLNACLGYILDEFLRRWLTDIIHIKYDKPTNKIEPKFKQGEWIVLNGLTLYVNEVVQGYYRTTSIGGIPNSYDWDIDNIARLWTIHDAKDGDILMANAPFIFNGNLEGGMGRPGAYCGINTLGEFQIPEYPKHWTGHTTTPATEEQRSILFSKMKEAGYIFDFEKKEPKKIINEKQIKKNLQDNSFRRMFEQKSTWSEEDEDYINDLIEYFSQNEKLKNTKEDIVIWVKSLKDRVQPQSKQEWSEEEIEKAAQEWDSKANFKPFYLTPTGVKQDITTHKESFKAGINWILKSLRPQNMWISVDEEVYVKEPVLAQKKDKSDPFGGFVVCCDHTLTPNVYERYTKLGSIVSQSTWKPSDEQMNLLEELMEDNNQRYFYTILRSLYQDLKKLREE